MRVGPCTATAAAVAVSVLGLLATGEARAEVFEVGPADDIEAIINAAQPGDEVVLAGGMYELSGRFGINVAGTAAAPIVVRAADGEQPHLHRAGADQNIIDIDGGTWLELRGIEFSGGSAGIRIAAADNLTIADCEIHSTNDVALRANDGGQLYESLHIVGNHIHDTDHTGEGMYLGCNDDGCRVANSVIERNYIHHTNQATITQGDGIELKEGSYGNVIRDNVIHDTNYPCLLTYSAAGNGPANIVERNVMWNCGDHGIQSAADTVIRNNIILSANQNGIAMQQHQSGAPANLTVVHNTVLNATNDALSLRDAVGAVTIANNALFADTGSAIFLRGGDLGAVVVAGNVGEGGMLGGDGQGYVDGSIAADFVDGHYGGMPAIDVFPAPGGALVGAGDPAHAVDDDFNTLPRAGRGEVDVGAYAFDPAGNPGWTIAAEFKEFPDDAGTTGGDDTGGADETGGPGDDSGSATDDGSDAGPGDASGGPTSGGGSTPVTSGGGGPIDSSDDEGCGCRSSEPPGAAWMLVVLAAALRRRRPSARLSRAG